MKPPKLVGFSAFLPTPRWEDMAIVYAEEWSRVELVQTTYTGEWSLKTFIGTPADIGTLMLSAACSLKELGQSLPPLPPCPEQMA